MKQDKKNRVIHLTQQTVIEAKIFDCNQYIEMSMDADPRLTQAQSKLIEALELVADYQDEQIFGKDVEFSQVSTEGYLSRLEHPIPEDAEQIEIIIKDGGKEREENLVCTWIPIDKKETNLSGLEGTAIYMTPRTVAIGFHAWKNSNSEFIYYRVIKRRTP